ncbi:hypothetical protein EYZ11_004661 [Aspergillus tanneri]|uniref:Uncharacterized protein n=1 Tax=Aspergillus tanneri TaxID=1220188 RepID=A0A4S3JK93_9EURO|nr:hypothetical protein EYZ11_004661 [Aspergillus tanneri]
MADASIAFCASPTISEVGGIRFVQIVVDFEKGTAGGGDYGVEETFRAMDIDVDVMRVVEEDVLLKTLDQADLVVVAAV